MSWAITLVCPGLSGSHMPFAINAKYVLLTYSQCGDLDGFSVMDHISGLGGECIIGRESHANGGVHLHVFCDFGRKFRSRRTDVFDVGGFHPNVVPSKGTPEKGYDYSIKDGDVICGGLGRPEPSGVSNGTAVAKWSRITGADCREEFWDLVHQLDPKSAACSFTQLTKYCDWKFAVDPPDYVNPTGVSFVGGEVDGRDDWLSQSGIGSGEPLIGNALRLPRCRGAPRLCRGFIMACGVTNCSRQMYVNLRIWRVSNRKDFVG